MTRARRGRRFQGMSNPEHKAPSHMLRQLMVRVEDPLYEELKARAAKMDRTLSWILREALKEYLKAGWKK